MGKGSTAAKSFSKAGMVSFPEDPEGGVSDFYTNTTNGKNARAPRWEP